MICFTTHNYFLFKRQEIWFYNGEKLTSASYRAFAYTLETDIVSDALEEWTSRIDLTKTEDQLFNSISPTFKQNIQTAIRSGIRTNINFSPSICDCKRISKEVKKFAEIKKFRFNKRRIFSIQKTRNICISTANIDNVNIVTHICLFDDKRIVLLHAFYNLQFEDDKMRSNANKLLHWREMQEFKYKQFELFDWGGINPENLPGITQFKLSFGGTSEKCYSYIKISPVFQLFFRLYKYIRK